MKHTSIIAAGALAVAVIAAAAWHAPATPARAATGDSLASFDASVTGGIPACSVGTGIAFDGTNLILSCWGSNVLQRVAAGGAHGSAGPITIAGMSDIGAMAFDSSRGKIWACQGGNQVFLIDPVTSTSVSQFAVAGCVDGLAYDGADDTIWASPDANTTISHYTNTGTLIASFSGLGAKLGGYGNSGIAVGGTNLYMGNNGGSQIYQCDKGLVACTLLSTFGARIEDLECDNVTFPGKNAIWSQDAYDRIMNAYEIPAGSCGLGGAPVAEATATSTATPQGKLKTHTPTRTPTSGPTETPVPPTNPPGGRAGAIVGPDTGSDPGDGSSRSTTLLFGGFMLAIAGIFVGSIGRKLRQ